ncbi:TetR/AcrR family transcriptional regulator [Streptomyces oceani]|uniref:HTH tetR-type domain-containing protein n=1 Tax=Streptomyces oceani TaxID=1075402 RepID=A0A1E7JXM5_9ACTN|nr:helix-turn-helix domain-containing protein [Streptomyces oceani]OEU96419.1 hypothetical protein AN216_20800 [Streptomyces oceani]
MTGGTIMQVQAVQDTTRATPLRVDARRNLEHVLRAAREVFGELGYGAPMEDVARRARVGVGTVYRRFPSKDVLVRHIAAEETARLTEQAQAALEQEGQPWAALSRFLHTSVASGAGRLLPPQVLRTDSVSGTDAQAGLPATEARTGEVPESGGGTEPGGASEPLDSLAPLGDPEGSVRVPHQRQAVEHERSVLHDEQSLPRSGDETGSPGSPDVSAAGPAWPGDSAPQEAHGAEDETRAAELLEVVGQLVARARAAGQLRDDVTVGDVLLVIATAAPILPDPSQQTAASTRLLEILLAGLRSPVAVSA